MPLPLQRVTARCVEHGFTLIELMVVLIVIGIVAAFAAPGFQSVINNGRLAGASNDVTSLLQVARSEAMRRRQRVILCGSDDGANCAANDQWTGILMFADPDRDGLPDAADVIRAELIEAPLQLWVSDSISDTGDRIVFRHDGFAYQNDRTTLLAANLSACLPTDNPVENVRDISLLTGARILTSRRDADEACAQPPNP